jgi:hypothetical protein
MAVLTLTPSRYALSTDFEAGFYAYAVADRPVKKLGDLVTPAALVVEVANDSDLIQFTLEPNSLVDEAEEFTYSIALFNQNGLQVYQYNIIMPTTNSNLFDIVGVTQDLDSCSTTTLEDNS